MGDAYNDVKYSTPIDTLYAYFPGEPLSSHIPLHERSVKIRHRLSNKNVNRKRDEYQGNQKSPLKILFKAKNNEKWDKSR